MTKSLSLMTMIMNFFSFFFFYFLPSLFSSFSVFVLQYLESEWLSGYTSYLTSHVAETDLFVIFVDIQQNQLHNWLLYLKSR